MKYIVTFCSRTNALKFYDSLKGFGANAMLINTPAQIKKGCGLSIKTDNLSIAKQILSYGAYNSFSGIYQYDNNGFVGIY